MLYGLNHSGMTEIVLSLSIAILAIDLDQRGTGLFRFILDTANANYPILHTKHQRSLPIFQDFIHDSQANFESPDLMEDNNETVVACVLKATVESNQDDHAADPVSQWLQQLVQLRTTGQLPPPTSSKRPVQAMANDQRPHSLKDSIALL